MGFANYLVTKGGLLVRQFIRSPNYVAGSAGWTVNKDGSAEFNSLTVRNAITVGTSQFWYNGAPGPGTLAFSVSEAPGTDPYGNAVLAGFASYESTTAMQVSSDLPSAGHRVALWTAASQAGPWTEQVHMELSSATFSFRGGQLQAIAGASVAGGTSTDTLDVTGAVTATGGTASSPTLITTDTWQTLGTLAGYTVNTGRFRLTPHGETELDVSVTAGGANAASTAFSVTLPAAYRPTGSNRSVPMATTLAPSAATAWPHLVVATTGVVSVVQQASDTATLGVNVAIPVT